MSNHQPTIRFIKSTNQGSAMSAAFAQMFKDETLVDVTLVVGPNELRAHRLVLSACSSYFRKIFEKQTNPYFYPIINIDHIYADDLRLVLEFMYKGEVMIPNERWASVARCANSLEVDGFPNSPSGMV